MSVKTVPVIETVYHQVGKRTHECVQIEAKRTLSGKCYIRFAPHSEWIPSSGALLVWFIILDGERVEKLQRQKTPLAKTTDLWVQYIPAKTSELREFVRVAKSYENKTASDYVSSCVENYIKARKAKLTKALTSTVRKPNGQDY